MIDWSKELEAVLADPLFDDVKAPKKRQTSSDRLIQGFLEIVDFYEANGRLPQDVAEEQKLFHRLEGVLKDEGKIARCRAYDSAGILPAEAAVAMEPEPEYERELTQEEKLEAILNDPLLADITDGADLGLFDVPDFMRQRLEARKEADYVGSRRPCEDFAAYEAGFKDIQQGLKSGKYRLHKFKEAALTVGRYFVEDGVVGYLAAFDSDGRNKEGRRDGRTRVIYENGSEADIKFRTITKNLSGNGYMVTDHSDVSDEEFANCFAVNDGDVESGTVYVLRSKSQRPEIAALADLYKIGFTVTSVESRIANARKEPTYLCADVEVVATWKVYNVKSSTLEALIHKLFASVQLQLTVDGHRPKEWFMVPFNIIEQAVNYIINGQPIMYDPHLRQLVLLTS